jgi:hypothetical protein
MKSTRRWNLAMAVAVILSGASLAAEAPPAAALVCTDACKNDCDYRCDDDACPVKDCDEETCYGTGGQTFTHRTQCKPPQ